MRSPVPVRGRGLEVDGEPEVLVLVNDDVGRRCLALRRADRPSVRGGEPERPVVEALHIEPSLVHQPVVGRAEHHEVVERSLPALRPMFDVMPVQPVDGGTAGEAAAAVAVEQRRGASPGGWRGCAGPRPRAGPSGPSTVGTMPPSQHRRRAVCVAMAVWCSMSQRPAPPPASTSASTWTTISCRSGARAGGPPDSNTRSAIHASASARRTVREGPRGRVPRGTSPWSAIAVHVAQVVPAGSGLPCRLDIHRITGMNRLPRRRPTWDVTWRAPTVFVVPTCGGLLGRVGVHRRVEGAEDARAHIRREPSVQDEGAVVFVPEGEAAILVLCIGLFSFLRASCPAVEAGERLDVLCGAVQSDVEEVGLVVRGGDTGEGADLGVAELALGEGFGEQGQFSQRPARRGLFRGRYGCRCRMPSRASGRRRGRPGRPRPHGGRARR